MMDMYCDLGDGVDMRTAQQLGLLDNLKHFAKEMHFSHEKSDEMRYFYNNINYSYGDATFLYCMLRHFRPKKLVEIGCGFSSGLICDVNERHFDWQMESWFIDPNMTNLRSVLKSNDFDKITVIEDRIQDVDHSMVRDLNAGDVLFIDTGHYLLPGNEVCHMLFNILPAIKSGVIVHIHDVFYPFEYPQEWIDNKWGYTELYGIHAFLQYNSQFQILLFTHYLWEKFKSAIDTEFPLVRGNPGASLWLRKN